MRTKAAYTFAAMPKKYAALCQVFPPRPIHDEVGYRNTVEVADAFAGFEERMTLDQNDYFDLLCELISSYEAATTRSAKLTSAALLAHLMMENHLSGANLSRILGRSPSLGPMILRGERKITAGHAVRLGKHFGLGPERFIREVRDGSAR